jgi:threonine dehydratase
MISSDEIRAAHEVIRPHIRRTPIVQVEAADFGVSAAPLMLKLELLQHAGSFKARGAFTSLLTRTIPSAGVVAASGGNHGAAVAYAAMKLKIPAKIFVPSIASPAKIQQITEYGAQLVIGGERYADALAASEAWGRNPAALRHWRRSPPDSMCRAPRNGWVC